MMGLLIESPEVARTQRSLFNLTWNKLETLRPITDNSARKASSLTPKPVQESANPESTTVNTAVQENEASMMESQESLF